MVYVVSKEGKPLMPTERHGKVRRLLKKGLARVIRREPFTIQLLYDTTPYTQPITVGIDTGSKAVGVSAIANNREIFSAEIELRQEIKKLLLERREYRRSRRYRKTRYRKPRFNNRRRPDGWLTPSLQWRADAHERIVKFINKILPIGKVVVEVAPFDIQKLQNPKIQGMEYQQGVQSGFSDSREYCLWRAGYKSELSGKKGILETHHIIPKSKGGTDNPSNLIAVLVEEHDAIHRGEIIIPKSILEKVKIFKDASYVSTIGWAIVNSLKRKYPVEVTYGSVTKPKRIELKLDKTHRNDAFVIAGGDDKTSRAKEWYYGKFFRRQNRSLHKANPIKGGIRPVNTIKEAYRFRRYDKVVHDYMVGIIYGLRSSGYFDIRNLAGEKIHASAKWNRLKLLEKAKTLMFERREWRIPLHPNNVIMGGVSCAKS